MRKRYFLKLVRKHLNGKATAEEEQLLLSYYNLFETEEDVVALLSDEEKQKLKGQMNAAIWEGISKQGEANGKIRHFRSLLMKVAAVLLIGGTVVSSFFLLRPHNEQSQIAIQQVISVTQNRFIQLPDGSTVIVMKDSRLSYLPTYNKLGKREVYLEGQAYFDVKHDPAAPFIVRTGNVQTTVLGTAFNISAIKGDNKIIVTVTRGKVSVGNKYKVFGTVTPNQQIICNTTKAVVAATVKKINADAYLSWKKQDLLFDDVTMEDAAKLLKDRFKVDITFTDQKLMQNRFTTTFPHDASLDYILNIICEFNNAAYTYDKAQAKIAINSKTN